MFSNLLSPIRGRSFSQLIYSYTMRNECGLMQRICYISPQPFSYQFQLGAYQTVRQFRGTFGYGNLYKFQREQKVKLQLIHRCFCNNIILRKLIYIQFKVGVEIIENFVSFDSELHLEEYQTLAFILLTSQIQLKDHQLIY